MTTASFELVLNDSGTNPPDIGSKTVWVTHGSLISWYMSRILLYLTAVTECHNPGSREYSDE